MANIDLSKLLGYRMIKTPSTIGAKNGIEKVAAVISAKNGIPKIDAVIGAKNGISKEVR